MAGSRKVVIVGGGVAGLTAAHELKERGFEITVFEAQQNFGGKAQSSFVRDKPDLKGLPAEHGFRFFPGFYHHLTDTLARIPLPGTAPRKFVVSNLVSVDHAA